MLDMFVVVFISLYLMLVQGIVCLWSDINVNCLKSLFMSFSLACQLTSVVLFCIKDVSDAQWRNFRGNIPVLTIVFGIFTLLAILMRSFFGLKVRGMSTVWLLFSLIYLSYLHGAW